MEQDDEYPIERPQEEDGFDVTVKEDKEMYLTARDGDHLWFSFNVILVTFAIFNTETLVQMLKTLP